MGSILSFRMEKNNSPSGIARKHTAQTLPSVTGFVVKLWMNAFLVWRTRTIIRAAKKEVKYIA